MGGVGVNGDKHALSAWAGSMIFRFVLPQTCTGLFCSQPRTPEHFISIGRGAECAKWESMFKRDSAVNRRLRACGDSAQVVGPNGGGTISNHADRTFTEWDRAFGR